MGLRSYVCVGDIQRIKLGTDVREYERVHFICCYKNTLVFWALLAAPFTVKVTIFELQFYRHAESPNSHFLREHWIFAPNLQHVCPFSRLCRLLSVLTLCPSEHVLTMKTWRG